MIDPTPDTPPSLPYDLVAGKLPAWIAGTHPDEHQQMRTASGTPPQWFETACQDQPAIARQLIDEYATHRQAEREVRTLLAGLPELRSFASQLLGKEIVQRFGLKLDVTATYLMNLRKAKSYKQALNGDPFVTSDRALKLATQSLLHSALQNFEADEAQPSGLEAGGIKSRILDSKQVGIVGSAKPLPIVAESFAAMTRELDIGGRYQALIDTLCAPPAVTRLLADAEASTLRLHLHKAFLHKHIDPTTYQVLLDLVANGQAEYQGQPVLCSHLTVLHATLTGAVVFGIAGAGPNPGGKFPPVTFPYGGWLVTYLPGMPEPLATHASRAEAEAFLLGQLPTLLRPEHQRLVPERSKAVFLAKARDTLEPYTWNPAKGYQERIPDPNAKLTLHLQPFTRPPLDELAQQRLQRLRDDAAFHAVPTATEDQKSAEKRLAYFESLALTALNIGAFFIPGLAPVMLGLTVLQLGHDVFEGLASWTDGEREQAFGYLMDVLENVALVGALGAAGANAGKPAIEKITVQTPSFIEELKPVELADGSTRLWKPDLLPFAHDTVLPADLKPDEFGLYHHQGKTWLALEDKTYAVAPTRTSGEYRIEHPSRPNSYQPRLRHNGAGAWLHELDRPRDWTGMTLFRRLGHLGGEFDEQAAQRILAVCDTDESVLRHILEKNQRLPALLEDTLQRFTLDRQVRRSLPDAGISARNAEFEKRYRVLSTDTTDVISRVYPALPKAMVDELLRNATLAERQRLLSDRIPLRLAEEIRLYQQHLRLTRACEGLYLDTLRNRDSDGVMLRMLERLPGWPTDLRIELHQRITSPSSTDSIGPSDAATQRSLNSAWAGYLETPGAETPDAQIKVHDSLAGAVFEVLSVQQRQALGVSNAQALQAQLRALPLPTRGELRRWLGLQRASFRSPMRLADGRIGYPLSGAGRLDDAMRSGLIRRLNELGLPQRLTRSAEAILDGLLAQGMSVERIQARLAQLGEERQELSDSLARWRAGDGVITDLAARSASRYEIEDALWRHWAHGALEGAGEPDSVLHLQQTFIAEFPAELPAFFSERTRSLRLDAIELDHSGNGSLERTDVAAQLSNLFRHFPLLEQLEILRPYDPQATASAFANHLTQIVDSFPQLARLRLPNQNLSLLAADIEHLGTLPLRELDLAGNTFAPDASFRLPDRQLDRLVLDRMGITQWPVWLDATALARVGELSLQGNNLTVVPHFLVDNPLSAEHHTVVALDDNAILPTQLQNLHLSQDGRPRRFAFTLDLPLPLQERLSTWLEERQQLHDAIDQWANASSSSALPSQATMASRNRIGALLLEYWEIRIRGSSLSPLGLADMALTDFPPHLPEFFYRDVEHLRLRNVDAAPEQLDAFLQRFPALNSLTLEGHVQPLRGLPSALLDSTRLYELNLREQGLVVDQRLMEDLGRVHGLIALDLSGNLVSPQLQVPVGLSRPLHRLYLRNLGLQSWPAWLDDIMPLYVLALDDNQLTELPEHILSNPENDDGFTSISLAGNPLSDATMRRAHLSQGRHRSYTFEMDLTLEILNLEPLEYASDSSTPGSSPDSGASVLSLHRHSPVPWAQGDIPNVQAWLQGSEQMQGSHRAQWQALERDGEAKDLLALAGRLTQSAPYRTQVSRSEFIDRLWRVLDMAADDQAQRLLFNGMAQDGASSRTCHDGALLVFKQIEEQLLVNQMAATAKVPEHDQYLYQMTRRLFRQRELDRIAREQAGGRDEAELRLAYHRRLATSLDLPAPADYMLYESSVRLHRGELETVERQVRVGEEGEAFLQFAVEFEPWVNALRHRYAARFERIDNAYLEAEERIDQQLRENPQLLRETLAQAALDDRESQTRQLLRELTNRAGRPQD